MRVCVGTRGMGGAKLDLQYSYPPMLEVNCVFKKLG